MTFYGCLPSQPAQAPLENGSNTTTGGDGTTPTPPTTNEPTRWYNSGAYSTGVTLALNNTKNIYLMGDQIQTYLSSAENFTGNYCLEVTFPQSNSYKPKTLRVKAIPSYSTNFVIGKVTRYFRLNLNSSLGNDNCRDLQIVKTNSNNQLQIYPYSTQPAIDTNGICDNCINIISSDSVTLLKEKTVSSLQHCKTPSSCTSQFILPIQESAIEYSKLSFRVDMNSSPNPTPPSCSTNICKSQGFDCCVQGQCVNEKTVKTAGVQNDPEGFKLAELEKITNLLWYKKYPEFYYSCLETPPSPTDPGTDNPSDPRGDAEKKRLQYIVDYKCLQEIKDKAEGEDFHSDPINSSAQYSLCNITDPTAENYYQSVFKRLYTNCGCSETDYTQMVAKCSKYTYRPIFSDGADQTDLNNIKDLACVTPNPATTPTPFQDLEVTLNSRSAPHRFFNTDGTEIDVRKKLPTGISYDQEGEKFLYLDEAKLFPKNGQFNMNSIIGQMNVQLTQARPAHIVDLEFDKTYYIATKSGYYSPCPNCMKDSWFSNFTSQPTSQTGVGVQGIGYTTKRDNWGTNSSFGNYEDTLFGRACWLPPTMLPFSHAAKADKQTQRQDRLTTQSALYANGYQRDWYGFNKGAVIGSFDGVRWFAIGKGRIAKSYTNKLYLAINAPFADLAAPTNNLITVQEYDFISTGAKFDYVPGLAINHASQNEAGSCQKYHECTTDSHCITKLGWEYSCVDVTQTQASWPKFTTDGADEIANDKETGSLISMLLQGELPSGSTNKRCVYRGAGAPCRVDAINIAQEGTRKSLTCAPNFYCASTTSSSDFNSELARYARPLEEIINAKNHLFGQEADVIGRPKNYIVTNNGATLPAQVRTNYAENLLLLDNTIAGKEGICRPGKKLPTYATETDTVDWESEKQHSSKDSKSRTDYISQIASCNSSLYTDLRYSSCPMLDDDGNYLHTQDSYKNDKVFIKSLNLNYSKRGATEIYSFAQNTCGLESLDPTALPGKDADPEELRNLSAFKTIEGRSLASADIQGQATLVQDACLRKAGAVCHTDLDCSPNKMHAGIVDIINPAFFGNSAEKKYYSEYLVCGQAEKEPVLGDSNFNTYNLHNNKCCRPVGENLTMYTEDTPDVPETTGLRTDIFGGVNPNNAKRYSRYSVVETAIDGTTKVAKTLIRPSANTIDANLDKNLDEAIANITKKLQWKTIHQAAAKTCCGAGWVRKFADGSNNWAQNRLNLNVSNFKCLNQRSPLLLTEDSQKFGLNAARLSKDSAKFCNDSGLETGGCIQQAIAGISDFSVKLPVLNRVSSTMILNSNPEKMKALWKDNLWSFSQLTLSNGTPLAFFDWNLDEPDVTRTTIFTELPSFIPVTNEAPIGVSLTDGDITTSCTDVSNNPNISFNPTLGLTPLKSDDQWLTVAGAPVCPDAAAGTSDISCCYIYNQNTRAFIISPSNNIKGTFAAGNPLNHYDKKDIAIQLEFTAPGTKRWEIQNATGGSLTDKSLVEHRRSSTPGNALYYLERLAKLEYIGIPQMTYEPIYCNDNYQKLVPGIFESNIQDAIDFNESPKTFINPNANISWDDQDNDALSPTGLNRNLSTSQELVAQDKVFSSHDFKCCLELGSVTTDKNMCCSGFAVAQEVNGGGGDDLTQNKEQFICKLPQGTDLNVYLNKFVSGEGLSDQNIDSPLVGDDFHPVTGEPKLDSAVLTKLAAIGKKHCASGATRRGGAFGPFEPEPKGTSGSNSSSEKVYSIIDSVLDKGNVNNQTVGYDVFNAGFRWNHHVYCEVE